ncbi:MAG TPA: hypothetical protein VMX35_08630 [Acidobacteriota bacterium]|nr:hypothetical protein [Acidobacteriota bacterium]
MSDSLIIGQIVASAATQLQTQMEGPGGAQGQEAQIAAFIRGQVLGAQVIELLAGGKALIEMGGERFLAEGALQLRPEQTITVRISELGPNLQLEVLAERTAAEQNLASALRSLFAGADTAESAASLARQVSIILDSRGFSIPEELLKGLAQQLVLPQVAGEGEALGSELRAVLLSLGLGLEVALREVAVGAPGAPVPGAEVEGLKGLLGRLIAALGQQSVTTITERETTAMLQAFQSRWAPLLGQRAAELTQLVNEVRQALETALRSTEARPLEEARQALETLPRGTEARLLEEALNNLAGRLRVLAQSLQGREAAPFQRAVEELIEQLTRRLATDTAREQLGKTAGELRDRLENLQLLNVHLRDRGLYQHILFPVSILGEMTEVQIKQYLSGTGKGKKGGSLTAVLLLDLETLGKIRIDALLQERTLYVNLFAEKSEVAEIAAGMEEEFAAQLESRGFRLALLKAAADGRKVDDFHRLDAEILSGGNGLVDLHV